MNNGISKLLVSGILICGLSGVAHAAEQDSTGAEKPRHAVGLSAGWVVANGLSYRRYIGAGFLQGTFVGMIDKEANEEYLDLSLSYGRYLNRFELLEGRHSVGVKMIAGVEAEHEKSATNFYFDRIETNHYINTGLGLGLDVGNPGRRGLLVSFNLIYTASFKGFNAREFTRLRLLPTAGIHFNF